MNTLLFTDVDYNSDEAWGAFELEHGVQHEAVYEAILRTGSAPYYLDLFNFPRENDKNYLLDHWQVHVSNASLLSLTGVPDLSTYDFANHPEQWQDFAQLHAQVHQNENTALGLT